MGSVSNSAARAHAIAALLLLFMLPLASAGNETAVIDRLANAALTGSLDISILNATASGENLTLFVRNNEPFPVLDVSVAAEIVKDNAIADDFPKQTDTIVFSEGVASFPLMAGETRKITHELGYSEKLGKGNYRLDLYLLVQDSSLDGRFERRIPNYFRRLSSSKDGDARAELLMNATELCEKLAVDGEDETGGCVNATAPLYANPGSAFEVRARGTAKPGTALTINARLLSGQAAISGGNYAAQADGADGSFGANFTIGLPSQPSEYSLEMRAIDGKSQQSLVRVQIQTSAYAPRIMAVVASEQNFSTARDAAIAAIMSRPKNPNGTRYLASATLWWEGGQASLNGTYLGLSQKAGGYGAVWVFRPTANFSSYAITASLYSADGENVDGREISRILPPLPPAPPLNPWDYLLPVAAVAGLTVMIFLPYEQEKKRRRKEAEERAERERIATARREAEAKKKAEEEAKRKEIRPIDLEIPKRKKDDYGF